MGLTSNALTLALVMIDTAAWGGAKARVVMLVGVNTLGNPAAGESPVAIGRRHVAEMTGLDERYTHRVLDELVADRVLVRVAGAGSRPHAYRVEPDVRAWRVPWAIDRQAAMFHVDVARGALRRPGPPFVARPIAPQTDFSARPSAPQDPALCAPQRATNALLSARPSAPQTLAAARAHSSSREGTSFLPSSEGTKEGTTHIDGAALVGLVAQRIGSPVGGRMLARIEAAAAAVDDPARLVEGVRRAPGHLGLPMLVALVEQVAAAPTAPAPSTAAAGLPGEDRRTYLERMVRLVDVDTADALRAELAALDASPTGSRLNGPPGVGEWPQRPRR